ncbi:MAG: TonB-dependent receptor [Pseudomonadota bacterium]|nr:TonB-dependent receptor [Pseudomonadota bacterium]
MAAASISVLASAQAAKAQDEPAPSDEIVVTGFRESLADALANKRNSTLIIESITAEDIGKFPDQNIAESLQRLSGVQIDRDNGQGTQVRIRGLDQNVTLLNEDIFLTGLEVFKVGEGNFRRDSSLEGIPAELLGGVDVYKSPNASLVEGGLGGIINLKTRSALDLKEGFTLAGNARASKGSDISGWKPVGAVVAGYNHEDRFGVVASFSYDKQNIHTDVLGGENRGNWAFSNRDDTATVPQDYYQPEYRYATDRDQFRERWGASVGLTFKPIDSVEMNAKWFHSEIDIRTEEASVKYPVASESPGLDTSMPYQIDANGVLLSGTIIANSAEAISFTDVTETSADNFQADIKFDNGGPLAASFAFNYAMSDLFRDAANNDVRYTQYSVPTADPMSPTGYSHQPANPSAPANYRYTYNNEDGKLPSFTLVDVPDLYTNPAYGFFKSHWVFGDRADLTNWSARGDVTYTPSWDVDGDLKFSSGFRYANREVDFRSGRYLADYHGKGELDGIDYGQNWTAFGYFQDGAIGFKSCEIPGQGPSGCTNRFGDSPPLITPFQTFVSNPDRVETIQNFWGSGNAGSDSVQVQDRSQQKDPAAWIQSLYPDTPFAFFEEPLESFIVEEKTISGYVMADFEDAGGNVHLNGGVRFINTELTVDQGQALPNPTYWGTDSWNGVLRSYERVETTRSYTDILPSINVVWNISDEWKARASAARVVARQDLFQLGRGFQTDFTRNPMTNLFEFTNGSRGNPELDPFRASQFDVSLEYYFGSQGLFAVTGYWKDVISFITEETIPVFVNDQAGGREGPVRQPVNGEGGKILGFEVAGQYAFDWGGGFNVNYTYSDSSSPTANDFDTGLPIPGVSKHAANAQVYYDNHGVEARLSYAWRSKSFDSNFGFSDGSGSGGGNITRTLGIWNRSYGQLDGQIVYHLTENFDLTAEAVNILKEEQSAYLQFENLPFRYSTGARRVLIGGRFRF